MNLDIDLVLELITRTTYLTVIVSAPMLLAALAVGLVISIFQSVTQIQEMTLSFIPKIVITALVMIGTMPWMMQQIMDYTIGIFELIGQLK